MRAAKKISIDREILRELVPLNELSAERFRELAEKLVVEEVKSGRFLFRKGDRDNQFIYLLDGTVNLIDGAGKVTGEVVAGTETSLSPISHQQPRPVSARAEKRLLIARIDAHLVDVFLTLDESSCAEVIEIDAEDDQDWMTRMLQSKVFAKIPPSKIQAMLMKLESVELQAGDVVIRQGDVGDYFYTIQEGRCAVTSKASPDAEEQLLVEFSSGDSFGEDALVSDVRRNATVTMLTDGVLKRLSKEDFVGLLKEPLVRRVDHIQALAMVEAGAVWIDVRTSEEHERGAIEDSVNIPLSDLREEMPELVFNAKYVLCCDTGNRSDSAAFFLGHKGFDVYVLKGGIAPLIPALNEETGADEDAGAAEPGTSPSTNRREDEETAAQQSVEQEEALELLRTQNDSLLAELEQRRTSEVTLNEQLELLRGELGESGEKLGALYSKAKADTEEKQQLREQYAALQKQHESQLNSLQQDAERARRELVELQSQVDAERDEYRSIKDSVAESHQSQGAEIARLQQELERANEMLSSRDPEATAAREPDSAELDGAQTALQEQRDLVTELRNELDQSGQDKQGLQDELTAIKAELQGKNEALAAQVESLQANSASLQDDSMAELQEQRELAGRLQGELEQAMKERGELQGRLDALNADQQASENELQTQLEQQYKQSHELEASLLKVQQELQAATEKLGEESRRADDLLGAKEALTEQLESLQAEQSAAEQATDEKQQRLESQLVDLRAELAGTQEQAREEKLQLEEMLQEQTRQADELAAVTAERDDLKNLYKSEAGDKERLQQENDSFREQISTMTDSADAQVQTLQSQLESGAARVAELEQQHSEKAAELEALRQEMGQKQDAGEALQEELDALRQKHAELQQVMDEGRARTAELEQQNEEKAAGLDTLQQELDALQQKQTEIQQALADSEAHASQLEQENRESTNKAHEDLTRKNHNEKELQGQIDRLRKQLEQATSEQQKIRESAHGDIDHIREELHSERKERAEERAEMAARQRELKEQLAAIATQHEENITSQTGAIEQARDAGREEERGRLQAMLELQAQSEDQLQQVQKELQQAHAEIAELDRQVKDRRQVDVELVQEQSRQADATIAQLESQLKQLAQERDESLVDQQSLREKLDILRVEVKSSRSQESAQLHGELDDARKGAEIADRLRAEAEAARDQLLAERDELREQLDTALTEAPSLSVPSLDEGEAGVSHPGPPPVSDSSATGITASPATKTEGMILAGVPDDGTRKRGRLRWVVGLAGAGILALVFWVWTGNAEIPFLRAVEQSAFWDGAGLDNSEVTDIDTLTPSVEKETLPAVTRQPEPVAEQPEPVVKEPVTAPPVEVTAEAGKPVAVITAGRTFRDTLKNGGQGPLMVELPGGSYQMGSAGNSLNFDEGPRHEVTLSGFSIGKYEVTFAEYDKFARATGRRLPKDQKWGRGKRPVINVSWKDARAYTKWLSRQTGKTYRLPTESEWEYAARATSTDSHWWGYDSDNVHANCFSCGSRWDGAQTAPVGSFPPNDFGLHEVAGNVQEWTEDCYQGGYASAPADGSPWLTPECTQRAVRGGSYTSPLDSLRSAKRGQYEQDTRLDNLGFRVVRTD